jgi:hypothetical protein
MTVRKPKTWLMYLSKPESGVNPNWLKTIFDGGYSWFSLTPFLEI